MAVGNNSNASFYNISNGKICRQFQSATPESKERVNKNGKTVHEMFYDFIDGTIVSIETKESEYGKSWLITLDDGESKQVLQMPFSSGYSSAFLKMLPNVDLLSPVKIIPKLVIEGDKKKTSLFVTQYGSPLKHYYTKDRPNGLPQMKQVKIKGKMTWDDSEMMEFFENMVKTDVVPNLPKGGNRVAVTVHDAVEVGGETNEADDLAF